MTMRRVQALLLRCNENGEDPWKVIGVASARAKIARGVKTPGEEKLRHANVVMATIMLA